MDSDMKQFDYCNSDTSTEETDHQSGKSSDEFSGARFYECTFCKRGFTNAQALGGHMNIHRKEKAKNKPKKAVKKGSLISSKTQEDDHEYRSNYSSHAIESQYYAINPFESHHHHHQMNNYQYYYPPENPSLPIAYHNMINDFAAAHRSSDHHMGYYEDHRISNLSLSIDGSSNELTDGSMTWNDNEIDLELRL